MLSELSGPHPIIEKDFWMQEKTPGVVLVGDSSSLPKQMYFSEENARRELERVSIGNSERVFWFCPAFSSDYLYRIECELYHQYKTSIEGKHPTPPSSVRNAECPVAGCTEGK